MGCSSFCVNLCRNINRRKSLPAEHLSTELRRCLGILDLILLGLSAMLGSGLYVLTGTVAQSTSGPSVTISYLVAAIAAFLSALCYAEFGSKIPTTGSSYIFTYLTMGELWGFLMGWNMVLEHGVGSASVAKAWSGYLDAAMGYPIKKYLAERLPLGTTPPFGEYLDLIGAGVVLLLCGCVALGAKSSTRFNMVFAFFNLAVILFIDVTGFCLADIKNWTSLPGGFVPMGFSGIIAGASRCFFAFAGFDIIASSCEEARNPKRDVPAALAVSLVIATISYVSVSAVLTLMVPWKEIVPKSAFPDAYGRHPGWQWAQVIVTVGSLCTMTTSMFSGLFVMPRILYAISKDGLLCPSLSAINERTQVPLISVAFTALLCSVLALLFDLETLVQFMSIGTLTAYSFVAACVILLRYGAVGEIQTLTNVPTENITDDIEAEITMSANEQRNASETRQISNSLPNQDVSRSAPLVTETSFLVAPKHKESRNTQNCEQIETFANGVTAQPSTWKCHLQPRFEKSCLNRLSRVAKPETVVLASLIVSVISAAEWMHILANFREEFVLPFWLKILLLIILISLTILSVFLIYAHEPRVESNTEQKNFKVPFVPIIPLLCIWINVFFMLQLQLMTWIRLVIWICVGLVIYFSYGYHYSLMNPKHDNKHWDIRLLERISAWCWSMRRKRNDEEELITQDLED